MKKRVTLTVLNIFFFLFGFSQSTGGGSDALRSDGKIYVVMAVVITILTGLLIYLVRIDRKISRMEKRNEI